VGIIQFMPSTAISLGTTTDLLSAMTAEDQLDYVAKYFSPYKNRIKTLEDTYMAILFPAAIGKPLDFVLFSKDSPDHPLRYIQNHGLDCNKDGLITKHEACLQVRMKLERGLLPELGYDTNGG
jgi:hypothetical protein